MNDIKKRAQADAQKKCDLYNKRDYEDIVNDYVEAYNKRQKLIKIIKRASNGETKLKDDTIYEYYYSETMEDYFSNILCYAMVTEYGYTPDGEGGYCKKKKGFFGK